MSLVRWNPTLGFSEMERQINDLFRRFTGESGTFSWPQLGQLENKWITPVDVFTRGNDLVVRAELPGINPEKDVEINVQDGFLILRGERRQEQRNNGERFFQMETQYGSFQRTIRLPEGVGADAVEATYRDGILEVVVTGGGEFAQSKKIPVKIAEGETKTLKGSEQGSDQQ